MIFVPKLRAVRRTAVLRDLRGYILLKLAHMVQGILEYFCKSDCHRFKMFLFHSTQGK